MYVYICMYTPFSLAPAERDTQRQTERVEGRGGEIGRRERRGNREEEEKEEEERIKYILLAFCLSC